MQRLSIRGHARTAVTSMANCIFATCARYEPIQIIPFIKSCRNVFSGDIVIAAGALPESTLALLKQYDVRIHDLGGRLDEPNFLLAAERYEVYRKVIENEKLGFDRALLCDLIDVIFQSDPFEFDPKPYRLKFFLEERRIRDCPINSGWVRDIYGHQALDAIGEQWISCSGTTLGSHDGIRDYLARVLSEYRLLVERCTKKNVVLSSLPYWRGLDQGFHNYLIYTGAFDGACLMTNRTGEVQTMQVQNEFIFSPRGQMLNDDRRLCPIVHQYNRYPNFFSTLLRANRISDGTEVQFQCATPAGMVSGRYST
jgi:hypothetical protein